MNKQKKSDRQIRLDKHHSTQRRLKLQKTFAVIGSAIVISIPIYILYFT
jgi:hypothetical protein